MALDPNFNMTTNTWSQIANKQSNDELVPSKLNSSTLITTYDPIYNKLVEQISRTIYHKLQVVQRWRNIGTTAPMNQYPGMLREIIMRQRKGQNFPMDAQTRPTTLLNYDIIDDSIEVRYHACQLRWMYGYTIFDEELRRFSGGNGTTITQLTEMKTINSITARNLFMDNLRKEVLALAAENIAIAQETDIDISSWENLTVEQAKTWLIWVDNILYQMYIGTTLYNTLGEFMQTPKSRLQMIMPRKWYLNVVRRAFPDTFHGEYFENILPENLVLVDSMGADQLVDSTGKAVASTWNDVGMNTTPFATGSYTTPADPNLQAVIMDVGAIGFEDNLNETLVGTKDIEKLATPVRMHYWTKAYMTDLLPMVKLVYNKPAEPTPGG